MDIGSDWYTWNLVHMDKVHSHSLKADSAFDYW